MGEIVLGGLPVDGSCVAEVIRRRAADSSSADGELTMADVGITAAFAESSENTIMAIINLSFNIFSYGVKYIQYMPMMIY